jgi:surface polysaccharide O-acyltransferase-like enzyme
MTTSPASRNVPPHPPTQGLPEKDTAPGAHSARFDVLRVSACLAVILLHLSATIVLDREFIWSAGWYVAVMTDAATRWCVVGFIMLSGALLLNPEKHVRPNEFWTKRAHRLMPALIVWPTIYLAWRYMFWKEPLTPELIAHDLFAGRPYIHLHFLFLIAGLYLATPLLATLVRHLNPAQLRPAILIIGFLAMAANLFDVHASSAFTMFVPYLAYYLAGWYCVRVMEKQPRRYVPIIGGTIAVMTATSVYLVSALGLSNRWSFYPFEDFSPTGIALAIAMFTFILHGQISPRIEALAQPLAPLTLGVYLAHPIVVELLRYGYFLSMPILLHPPYYIPVTFLATCALTFGLVMLMQRVPGLRRLV